nr:membrane protein insertion efficiency factor YidD [uncultured Neokomagataea sp.]
MHSVGCWLSRCVSGVFLLLIKAYKLGISPFLGQNCRFEPGCSTYGLLAIRQHGPWRGGYLTVRRICRCHPWSKGGIDYPPPPDSA